MLSGRWTGTDCGRAIREGGARLRAAGLLAPAPVAPKRHPLVTMLAVLSGCGAPVSDQDMRALEKYLAEPETDARR